jgi:hypothetical protein
VFAVDGESKLKVVKADQALNEDDVYYVIENNRLDAISKRIEKKVKKGIVISNRIGYKLMTERFAGNQIRYTKFK